MTKGVCMDIHKAEAKILAGKSVQEEEAELVGKNCKRNNLVYLEKNQEEEADRVIIGKTYMQEGGNYVKEEKYGGLYGEKSVQEE